MTDITGLLFVVLGIVLWLIDRRQDDGKKLRFIGDTVEWK